MAPAFFSAAVASPFTIATTLLASSSSSAGNNKSPKLENNSVAQVTGLYRYPVKGLSEDVLDHVTIASAGETFPDDRRFALLKESKQNLWKGGTDGEDTNWLHKENFLCTFTAPELLAQYQSSYQIVFPSSYSTSNDDHNEHGTLLSRGSPQDGFAADASSVQRMLELRERSTNKVVLHPTDLATEEGRNALAQFLSLQQPGNQDDGVVCVTSDKYKKKLVDKHQFGNTSSGVKQRNDTRTVHIINAATVRDLSSKIGIDLDPTRFRPNIVIDGPPAWSEFDWIDGKSLQATATNNNDNGVLTFTVIAKTVRCEGVGIDPNNPEQGCLDIPALLMENFDYGPFLGVYAVIDTAGSVAVGDQLQLLN